MKKAIQCLLLMLAFFSMIMFSACSKTSEQEKDFGYDMNTVEGDRQILGFTIYHVTYSYIAGLEGLDIKAYRQFKDRTVILLNEKAKQIDIDNFLVGGSRNNAYLRIDSIAVNYIEG